MAAFKQRSFERIAEFQALLAKEFDTTIGDVKALPLARSLAEAGFDVWTQARMLRRVTIAMPAPPPFTWWKAATANAGRSITSDHVSR